MLTEEFEVQFHQNGLSLTEVAGEGGPDLAPQKFLLKALNIEHFLEEISPLRH